MTRSSAMEQKAGGASEKQDIWHFLWRSEFKLLFQNGAPRWLTRTRAELTRSPTISMQGFCRHTHIFNYNRTTAQKCDLLLSLLEADGIISVTNNIWVSRWVFTFTRQHKCTRMCVCVCVRGSGKKGEVATESASTNYANKLEIWFRACFFLFTNFKKKEKEKKI